MGGKGFLQTDGGERTWLQAGKLGSPPGPVPVLTPVGGKGVEAGVTVGLWLRRKVLLSIQDSTEVNNSTC